MPCEGKSLIVATPVHDPAQEDCGRRGAGWPKWARTWRWKSRALHCTALPNCGCVTALSWVSEKQWIPGPKDSARSSLPRKPPGLEHVSATWPYGPGWLASPYRNPASIAGRHRPSPDPVSQSGQRPAVLWRCGWAEGVASAVPSMEMSVMPNCDRVPRGLDALRPVWCLGRPAGRLLTPS